MNIHTAAAPMTAVATQPRTMNERLAVKAPITDFFETSRMITVMSGTATIPLITALQNRDPRDEPGSDPRQWVLFQAGPNHVQRQFHLTTRTAAP